MLFHLIMLCLNFAVMLWWIHEEHSPFGLFITLSTALGMAFSLGCIFKTLNLI